MIVELQSPPNYEEATANDLSGNHPFLYLTKCPNYRSIAYHNAAGYARMSSPVFDEWIPNSKIISAEGDIQKLSEATKDYLKALFHELQSDDVYELVENYGLNVTGSIIPMLLDEGAKFNEMYDEMKNIDIDMCIMATNTYSRIRLIPKLISMGFAVSDFDDEYEIGFMLLERKVEALTPELKGHLPNKLQIIIDCATQANEFLSPICFVRNFDFGIVRNCYGNGVLRIGDPLIAAVGFLDKDGSSGRVNKYTKRGYFVSTQPIRKIRANCMKTRTIDSTEVEFEEYMMYDSKPECFLTRLYKHYKISQ